MAVAFAIISKAVQETFKRVAEYFTAMLPQEGIRNYVPQEVMEFTKAESNMVDAKGMMCATDPRHVRHLTAASLSEAACPRRKWMSNC